jgi:hypothetical protein
MHESAYVPELRLSNVVCRLQPPYAGRPHKTAVYLVFPWPEQGDEMPLGHVRWRSASRSYGFYPLAETSYPPKALLELAAVCDGLTVAHTVRSAPEGGSAATRNMAETP